MGQEEHSLNSFLGVNKDMALTHPERAKIGWDARNIIVTFGGEGQNYKVSNELGTKKLVTLPNIFIREVTDDSAKWEEDIGNTITPQGSSGTALPTHIGKIITSNEALADGLPSIADTIQYSYYNVTELTVGEAVGGGNFGVDDMTIIGGQYLRDELLIFSVKVDDSVSYKNNIGAIWKVTVDEALDVVIELLYVAKLGFKVENPIKAITRFESSAVQKIYWEDGKLNLLRFFNITRDNFLKTYPEHLNITPKTDFSMINLTKTLPGGDLDIGIVQYIYCLYDVYGAESKRSPVSNMIPITKNSKGASSGKGDIALELNIPEVDTKYDNLKVFRLHYTSKEAVTTPTIHLIADIEITESSHTIVDNGSESEIATSTLTEISNLGGQAYYPNSLITKDNRLVLANIKETKFHVDYDARVYRFKKSTTTTKAYTTSGASVTIDSSVWEDFADTDTLISPFNKVRKGTSSDDELYQFKLNSTAVGATGPNVSIGFSREQISESTYKNSANYHKRGLKTQEIYRIGVQFWRSNGQLSFTNWIGDIRAPYMYFAEYTTNYSFVSGAGDDPHILVLDVTLDNLDTLDDDIVGYRIVRAERTTGDEIVVSQGIVNPVVFSGEVTNSDYAATMIPSPSLRWYSVGLSAEQGFINNEDISASSATNQIAFSGSGKYQFKSKYINFYSPDTLLGDSPIPWSQDSNFFAFVGGISPSSGKNKTYVNGYVQDGDGDHSSVFSYIALTSGSSSNEWVPLLTEKSANTYMVNTGTSASFTEDTAEIQSNAPMRAELRSRSIYQNSSTVTLAGDITYADITDLLEAPRGSSLLRVSDSGGATPYRNYLNIQGSSHNSKHWKDKKYIYSYHCKAIFAQINDSLETIIGANIATQKILLVDYCREDLIQYGGYDYSAVARTKYMPVGDYQKITASSHTQTIYNGDTFVAPYNFHRLEHRDDVSGHQDNIVDTEGNVTTDGNNVSIKETVSVVLETRINLALREDDKLTPEGFDGPGDDFYNYNSVYQKENNYSLFSAISKPRDFIEIEDFDTIKRYSDTKIPNEKTDSFLKFYPLDYDLSGAEYGPISGMYELNDQILVTQRQAIGHLVINPTSALSASNGSVVYLGTGAYFHDYKIIKTTRGTSRRFGAVTTPFTLYVVDDINNAIVTVGDKLNDASEIKGFDSWLEKKLGTKVMDGNPIEYSGVLCGYDSNSKITFFTFHLPDSESFTLAIDETSGNFIGFRDFYPTYYLNGFEHLYSFAGDSNTGLNNKLWLHGFGDPGNYYGQVFDSSITYVIAHMPTAAKIFYNLIYNLEVYLNGVNNETINFKSFRCWNNYQDSGTIDLSTYTKAERTFRRWGLEIPTDLENSNDYDKESPLLSNYLYVELKFDNSLVNDEKVRFYMQELETVFASSIY